MTKKIILFLSVILVVVLSLQGIAVQHEEPAGKSNVVRYPEEIPIDLDANVIYSTNNTITGVSLVGKSTEDYMVAWQESIKRDETNWDTDIFTYDYPAQSVNHYGVVGENDWGFSVSSRSDGYWVVWERNGSIESNHGTLLAKGNLYSYSDPSVYGDKLAFKYTTYYEEGGIKDISIEYTTIDNPTGDIKKVNFPGDLIYCSPIITDEYLAACSNIYSFSNGSLWNGVYQGGIYAIYKDWVISAGVWNFQKSIFIDAINIKTGEYERIASFNTGYDFFDSISFDNYLVAFSYDYSGYIYNVLSHKLYKINNYAGDVWHIAIGGGQVAWTDYYGHNIRVANAPDVGSFVEVKLQQSQTGLDESPNTLMVIDSQGRKYGYDADWKMYREIPGVVEVNNHEVMLFRLSAGNGEHYKYQVIGLNDGKYSLTIKRIGASTRASITELVVKATNISIKSREINQYVVDWQKVASKAADAVKLSIDVNGDGTFEREITASSEITNDVKEGTGLDNMLGLNIGGMMCIAGIAVVVIVIVLIVVLIFKKKK